MATQAIQVPGGIGPAFSSELAAAGLGDGISWSSKGTADTVWYDNTIVYGVSLTILNAVIAAHNPLDPAPPSSDMQKREYIVDYGTYLKSLSDAVRKQQTNTAEFETFLDNIIYIGVEGF